MGVIDISGKKYGRLTVIQRNGKAKNGNALWLCKCDCGKTTTVDSYNLRSGHVKSCGCLAKEQVKKRRNYNKFEFNESYYIGYTSNTNKPFYFDKEDYEKVSDHCWMENDSGYAVSVMGNPKRLVRMHRFILGLNEYDPIVDHKNQNKLDNRKSNLRLATRSTNGVNRGHNSNSKTKHKGIYQLEDGWYQADICKDYKTIHIGKYKTIEEAIIARHKKEKELFGEFAFNGIDGERE